MDHLSLEQPDEDAFIKAAEDACKKLGHDVVIVGGGNYGKSLAKRILMAGDHFLPRVENIDILGAYPRGAVDIKLQEPDDHPLVSGKMMALLSRGVKFPPRKPRTEDQQG
ncbi:hypothetical protein [Pseudomonas phage D6]|nr:hypothetical protein [Pseudomonas phage D6]